MLVSEPTIKKVDITVRLSRSPHRPVPGPGWRYVIAWLIAMIQAGTDTGRAIGSIVGSNLASYTAELGGKAPIVVFDDADVQSAANGAAFACFVASGQTCVSGARLIVQDKIYDAFMERFMQKVESVTRRMGNRACIPRSSFNVRNP